MNKKEQLLIEIEKSVLYVPCDMDEKKELMIKYEQSINQLINSVKEEYLQEKLNDYDVGSLEYQIVEAIIRDSKE